MKKSKKVILSLLMIAVVFFITTTVDASVEYTRNFPSNDGTIEINLTGLQLDESKQYEFSLVLKGGTPAAWNLITSYTSTTAKLSLNPESKDIVNILKVTDDGQVFVREKDSTGSYIVDRLDVNLKLPYLKAVSYEYEYNNSSPYNFYTIDKIYNSIGGGLLSKKTFYKFEKVTDKNFIEEFLKNKKDIDRLESILPTTQDNGYIESEGFFSDKGYRDGLYILWIKQTGENCKTVQAAIIHDGLPNATTLAEYGIDTNIPVDEENPPQGEQADPAKKEAQKAEEKEEEPSVPKRLPDAGITFKITVSIIVVSIIGMYTYNRHKNLNGI